MTGFYPPKPASSEQKLSPFRRLTMGRYSALDVIYEKSYKMKLGKVSTPWKDYFFANEPKLVNEIMKNTDRFPKSNLMGAVLRQLLGKSIFITNGELWKNQREMMAPSFEHARISDSFEKMVTAAEKMVERLESNGDNKPFQVDNEMAHVTADIIFRTIFSKSMTKEDSKTIFNAFNIYQELIYAHGIWTLAGVPESLSILRIRANKYAAEVRQLLGRFVNERTKAESENHEEYSDILQSLIQAKHPKTGEGFNDSELVDQVGIMFLAGHETSASALSWALYLISNVPEVAERMTKEADEFWSGDGAAVSKLKILKYTRDVFRETMRLYPPVAMLPRDAVQQETMRGKTVAKKSIIMISPWLIHRQKSTWKNPDMFDPDRFQDKAQEKTIRDNYMPFSKGPRVCLGASFALQEGVLILSAILRNYKISKVEDHTPEPVARLTLRPINGVKIKLLKRVHT